MGPATGAMTSSAIDPSGPPATKKSAVTMDPSCAVKATSPTASQVKGASSLELISIIKSSGTMTLLEFSINMLTAYLGLFVGAYPLKSHSSLQSEVTTRG